MRVCAICIKHHVCCKNQSYLITTDIAVSISKRLKKCSNLYEVIPNFQKNARNVHMDQLVTEGNANAQPNALLITNQSAELTAEP